MAVGGFLGLKKLVPFFAAEMRDVYSRERIARFDDEVFAASDCLEPTASFQDRQRAFEAT